MATFRTSTGVSGSTGATCAQLRAGVIARMPPPEVITECVDAPAPASAGREFDAQAQLEAAQAKLRRAGLGTGGAIGRAARAISRSPTTSTISRIANRAQPTVDRLVTGTTGVPVSSLRQRQLGGPSIIGPGPSPFPSTGTLRDRLIDTSLDLITQQLVPSAQQADPCPGGFRIPGTNRCFEGPIQPQQPVATAAPVSAGVFGALSVEPQMFSTVRMRCPPGLVLGKDNRCYTTGKGGISNSQRKWPKAPRPVMTAMDRKILNRAESVKNRVKKLAGTAGFTCKKKG